MAVAEQDEDPPPSQWVVRAKPRQLPKRPASDGIGIVCHGSSPRIIPPLHSIIADAYIAAVEKERVYFTEDPTKGYPTYLGVSTSWNFKLCLSSITQYEITYDTRVVLAECVPNSDPSAPG